LRGGEDLRRGNEQHSDNRLYSLGGIRDSLARDTIILREIVAAVAAEERTGQPHKRDTENNDE
jgi:hypothetical protein